MDISARVIMVMVVTVSMLLTALVAQLQPWSGHGGNTASARVINFQGPYDPSTVEAISGTVESVDKTTPMRGMHYGIHLLVRTDKETISVHLGPGWYIERLDTEIEKGDKLQVKGSRITMRGKPTIIAAEVKKGDAVMKLRDGNGIPVWSGWR